MNFYLHIKINRRDNNFTVLKKKNCVEIQQTFTFVLQKHTVFSVYNQEGLNSFSETAQSLHLFHITTDLTSFCCCAFHSILQTTKETNIHLDTANTDTNSNIKLCNYEKKK